ncbi:MAG: WD40 repeat domain-containing protein [Sandaracinaceae bacterium]
MPQRHAAFASVLLLLVLGGCAEIHETPPDVTFLDVYGSAGVAPRIAPIDPTDRTPLESCLEAGGSLDVRDAVFNNDQADHGELLRFGISEEGHLAVAGADGTLKFWTLERELLGEVDGSLLTYGEELPASPITDLVYDGDTVIAGDVRGLVAQLSIDQGFLPIGGTTPGIEIRSVAFDATRQRLAHAQVGEGVPSLVVRGLESGDVWEIGAGVEPRDLAFTPSGRLVVAGERDGTPFLEVYAADDPSVVEGGGVELTFLPGRIVELAQAEAGTLVVATDSRLAAFDARASLQWAADIALPAEHGPRSVAVTPNGRVAFSVGADGRLLAVSLAEGATLADLELSDPVAVRVDATGSIVLVGQRDGWIRAVRCVTP